MHASNPWRPGSSMLKNFASAEQAVFADLMFLPHGFHGGNGRVPTHEILTTVARTLDVLATAGTLPRLRGSDRTFLMTILQISLVQIAGRHDVSWLDGTISELRARLGGSRACCDRSWQYSSGRHHRSP